MGASGYRVGVIGNPNCGKTTLFNALTGSRQHVGNWPGVTVERKVGSYRHAGREVEVVDLPGTYSLDVTREDISLDEQIARDFAHAREADLLLNIVDASNLERNLYLTAQLIEMRRPMLVVLTMLDMAERQGLQIDRERLAEQLGCPVVGVQANARGGLEAVREAIAQTAAAAPVPASVLPYTGALAAAIAQLQPRLIESARRADADAAWLAGRLLEEDDLARRLAGPEVIPDAELADLRAALEDDVDMLLADARYGFAHVAVQAAVRRVQQVSRQTSDRLDRLVLNRVLGIPIFLAMMYLMFMFTINIGGAFIDLFDMAGGTLLVDGPAHWLTAQGAPAWLTVLLAQGLGGGIQVVVTFIPVVAFLFLFLSILEDSGYMARAAFVMDRAMRALGLPGKSFVPLIVGFGCNVPAIMATRTLEYQRDRILTIVMTPFMSCGARLPVYALFIAAFFPLGGQNLVFGLYLIGILVAVITGLVLKNTLLQGEPSPFLMELPPYHLPRPGAVLIHTGTRTWSFITRAGQIIVPMVLVLNVLSATGTDGSFTQDNTEHSVLSEVGRAIAPAFAPLGLDADNWPAAVGILTGVLAKEAVVGSLDSLYGALGEGGGAKIIVAADAGAEGGGEARPGLADVAGAERAQVGETSKVTGASVGAGPEPAPPDRFDLAAELRAAFATVPTNLAAALGGWRDPLGFDLGESAPPMVPVAPAGQVNTAQPGPIGGDLGVAAADGAATGAAAASSSSVFGAMAARFDGAAGAFAYLLFILLYMPCTAALAAVYRETSGGWTLFVAAWTTGVAYITATLFYQASRLAQAPQAALGWIMLMLGLFILAVWVLRWWGRRTRRRAGATALAESA